MKKLSLMFLAACTNTTELTRAPRDAAVDAALPTAVVALCSNGLDDDGDDLVDGFDPECTAPFDDSEDSFATGSHDEDRTSKCQDCFWDDNSGSGDDGCARARTCALDGTARGGTGQCRECAVDAACQQGCAARAPNGCDCFGCCDVFRDGARVASVLLNDACSLDALDDPNKCVRCLPAPDCMNPCGECELCTGRSASDLPARCGAGGFTCEGGPSCGEERECAGLSYCQQGCCLATGI